MAHFAIIQSPAPKLDASMAFYQRAGFRSLEIEGVAGTTVTDGRARIRLNPDPPARNGVVLAQSAWASRLESIEKSATVLDNPGGRALADPNGMRVYLSRDNFEVPEPEAPFGMFGKFVGLGIESVDLEASVRFWAMLGYEPTMGAVDQGWIALSAGNGVDVSFMRLGNCPHMFPQGGLTYFNSGKNLEVISAMRKAEIPISQEITCFNEQGIVDNVIVHDPGFTGFFIFND